VNHLRGIYSEICAHIIPRILTALYLGLRVPVQVGAPLVVVLGVINNRDYNKKLGSSSALRSRILLHSNARVPHTPAP
jgi:hypothetical protein